MTVAAFERAEPSSERRPDSGALVREPVALATIITFASLILLVGRATTRLGFGGGVAMMLTLGSLWLLMQGRTDVRKIAATGAMHLGVVVLVGAVV